MKAALRGALLRVVAAVVAVASWVLVMLSWGVLGIARAVRGRE